MAERRYSDPVIFARKNKGFQAFVQYTDDNGKRRQKSRILKSNGVRARQAEAKEWREQLEDAWQDELAAKRKAEQEALDALMPTIESYIASYIDSLLSTGSIERSTGARYRQSSKHITEHIGSVKLEELTANDARDWIACLNAQGYAPTTVKKALMILKAALDQAERDGLIERNPLRGAKLAPKITRREPNALDSSERARLVSYLNDNEGSVSLAIRMALFTGMRIGEVCGLRWSDVDFAQSLLHIRNALGKDKNTYYDKEPKNGGSRRDIPLPQSLIAALRLHHAAMQEQCLAAGVRLDGSFYVVGHIDGTFMTPNYLTKKWRALARGLELVGTQGERPVFHDLRHTFATAAIANGMDVKTVSGILGHANAAMTLNIYASPDPEARRSGMDRMDNILNASEPSATVVQLKTGTHD